MSKTSSKAIAKINRWKSNFLDLSNRNTQLNFNPSSKSYIEILHPDCTTLFKILVVLDQTGTFPSVFKHKVRKSRAKKSSKTAFETTPEPIASKETQDKHLEALEIIKKKARLTEVITKLTDNVLETRIKRIIRKNQDALDERGINILYITFGLLKWKEKGESTYTTSPLLFIPAKLSLKPLSVDLLDDEVIVNPALREKLLGEQIRLPKFGYEFDSRAFEHYFSSVEEAISIEPSWELQKRSFIGTFSFTKAPLFEDLDDHQTNLLNHPIVRAIAEEQGFAEKKENLPDRNLLGDKLAPTDSYAILDCDSSQMEAVLYAKSGSSLVIQGPPGTGKSQCIANIIAESLAVGKKVLFVAQKRAALDVVKKRLEKCGVGDFCLQVHSQNTNKKEMLQQIEHSMNLNQTDSQVREGKFKELGLIREKLNEYVETINQSFGKMDLSLYEIMGHLLKLEEVPLIDADIRDPKSITEPDFVAIKDLFNQLELFRKTMENYDDNPWRYSRIVSPLILSPELHLVLRKLLVSFKKGNTHLQEALRQIHLKFSPDFINKMSELNHWQKTLQIGKYWGDILRNIYDLWETMDSDFYKLSEYFDLDSVVEFEDLDFHSLKQIRLAYEDAIPENKSLNKWLNHELAEYLQQIENFNNRVTVWNLKSKLKPIQGEKDLIRLEKFFNSYNENALLLDVDSLVARFTIDYTSWFKRKGQHYKTDKESILACLRVPNPKANVMGHLNIIKAFQDEFGKPFSSSPDFLIDLLKEFDGLFEQWKSFRELDDLLHPLLSVSFLTSEFQQNLWDKNHIFATQWYDNLPYLNDWFEVQVRKLHLRDLGMGDLFDGLINQKLVEAGPDKKLIPYEKIFEKTFYSIYFTDIKDSLPPIANFNRKFHEKELDKFIKIDSESLLLNQGRLQAKLFGQRPKSDLDISDTLLAQTGYIKRELKKKRNVKPLRQTFMEAQEYITLLKPCFLMSPLSIANYLAVEKYEQFFDIVIFDEASQVTPEDAIGAILRGKSLIVVGDSEQLPPTNFFSAQSKAEDDFDDPELDVEIQSMESLLDECTGIGFREKLLKFHYRSKKEGLIAFSNINYYNGRLFSFPDIGTGKSKKIANSSPDKDKDSDSQTDLEAELDAEINEDLNDLQAELENYQDIVALPAIDFHYISKGRKLKGTNKIEAEALAHAILNHYKSNEKYQTKYSLGIVAFSQAQQETIQKALDNLVKLEPSVESLIYNDPEEPLFIKNLESVQGDERDFIFFSIGYGKDMKGKMSLNFGPLNRSGGYRRLNVAITRARYHIKLFASFLPGDIPLDRVKARGLRDLVAYMKFARLGILPGKKDVFSLKEADRTESFEADVERTLEELGYEVELKVGSSDFKIDLAVVDPDHPSKYILGIELDGGSYKDAENARDRDRIRTSVLQMLGWNMIHIWSMNWYTDKAKEIRRIKRNIKKAK